MHRVRRARAPRALALLLPALLPGWACAPGEPAPPPPPAAEEAPPAGAEGGEALERARELLDAGEAGAALRTLLDVPPEVPGSLREPVSLLAAEAATRLSRPELEEMVASRDVRGPALPPTLGELALALHFEGREEEALARAREALAVAAEVAETADEPVEGRAPGPDGASAPGLRIARAVIEGRIDEVAPPVVLGLVLPVSGSPTFQRYARLVEEGVQVAVAERGAGVRRAIRMEIGDDGGLPSGAATAVEELSAQEPFGVVGPLVERGVREAIRARGGSLPMISPTARMVPEEAEAVYSLAGFDPGAADALADFASTRGLRTAAIVRPDASAGAAEARAFREAFAASGGTVVLERTYPPGSSHFRDVLAAVDTLRPQALFLPLPPEDVPLLAPQLTFFGLDSLGMQILGNRSWTGRDAIGEMDSRHLEAVVVATDRLPGESPPGWERFVRAYEQVHRRTLRGEVPAYGYDAAALLLEAAARGGASPEGVRAGLRRIRDFPGATGTLSVSEGRIVRHHVVVVFEEGVARPVAEGEVPALARRDHLREERERRERWEERERRERREERERARQEEERRDRPPADPTPRPRFSSPDPAASDGTMQSDGTMHSEEGGGGR